MRGSIKIIGVGDETVEKLSLIAVLLVELEIAAFGLDGGTAVHGLSHLKEYLDTRIKYRICLSPRAGK